MAAGARGARSVDGFAWLVRARLLLPTRLKQPQRRGSENVNSRNTHFTGREETEAETFPSSRVQQSAPQGVGREGLGPGLPGDLPPQVWGAQDAVFRGPSVPA